MNKDFENSLKQLSNKLNINLNEEQIKKYFDYMNLLLEWNEKINLTAIIKMDEIILKHFVDSMTILKYVENKESMIDVGTGAGFPGIPVSIMMPNLDITLLDSLNKRITFLNQVKEDLNLENIKTIHGRAEELGKNKKTREIYDIAVSRAVANMSTLVEYLMPLTKVGGICICMKGVEIENEIEEAKFAINELGGKIEKIDNITLPGSDIKRNIVIIRKIKETPNKYPRKAGIPSKQPLK